MKVKRDKTANKKFKPRLISQMPRRETAFLRILKGWRIVSAEDPFTPGRFEFIFSPELKVYRRANSWEIPDLVIDSDILPPEHHIRLVRVRHKMHRVLARKLLKKQDRLLEQARKSTRGD